MEIEQADREGSWGSAYMYYPPEMNKLSGRMLTYIESLGFKENQERAVKDIIKGMFGDFYKETFYVDRKVADDIREYGQYTNVAGQGLIE